MGEVYRAADSKLGRDVTLKVILQEFAQDTQLMARFQREAQVLASLNHTNIASIYGLEDSEGVHALVMELVEGPTLADRIKEGAIPLEEASPIAKQIAEALEYAHEHGARMITSGSPTIRRAAKTTAKFHKDLVYPRLSVLGHRRPRSDAIIP
jgi:eukaryotic-like serine/threonine-protein kinase